MVDRRLVGFMAIILVITTILSFLIFRVGEKDVAKILAQRTPSDIPGGVPGSPSYSLDVMAVRDLPDLVIRFNFLVSLSVPLVKPWNETAGRKFEDMIANFPRLKEIRTFLDSMQTQLGGEPTYKILQFELGGTMYLFDFTDAIAAVAGEDTITTVYTMYAFIVGSEGTVSVFGGYRDFFFSRDTVISRITYTSPKESMCFRSKAAIGEEACSTIDEAPVGILHLHDLAAGQKMHMEVTLDTFYMFGHGGIIQMISVETGYGPGPITLKWIGSRT